MSFPRYPRYKASGVEWLGQVPEHWEVFSLRRCLVEHRQGYYSEAAYVDVGVKLLRITDLRDFGGIDFTECPQVEDRSDLKEFLLKESDFVFARTGGAGTFGLVESLSEPVAYASYLIRFRFAESAHARFLRHYFLSSGFGEAVRQSIHGGVNKNIHAEDIKNQYLSIPPFPEQTCIAAFLDRETAKIDGLVAEQRRLMELLKEKRHAVVSHAVTRGLNPKVPLKSSGVKWLGDIPEHWGVTHSRRMFSVRSEPALERDKMLTASQKYGVLYQSDFVEREGRRVVEVIMGKESLKHVEPDDFIISMRSFQGGLEWCRLRGSTSFHYVMITPIKWVHPPFFAHLFKSGTYIQALRATTDLIRDGQELRFSNFAQVDLPIVPIEEQAEIAVYLSTETARFDTLTAEAQRAIDLLQERRTALISAAVTGQIDVRHT